jgi:uncharacterized protein (TIGR02466 family)
MKRVFLFPSAVFFDTYECDESLQNLLNTFPFRNVNNEYSKQYGRFSDNTQVLQHPDCGLLKQYVIQKSEEVMKHGLGVTIYDGVRIVNSWVSSKETDSQHSIHSHPNSILSGVYYYDEYDESSPPLVFHRYLENVSYELCIDGDQTNPVSMNSFIVQPQKNMIVFFPSYLKHSVPINNSKTRKCLAFNVVPNVFSKGEYTEL